MPLKNNLKKKAFSPWLLFVISVLAVLVVALLLTNIMERRVEAVQIVNSGADVGGLISSIDNLNRSIAS